MTKRPNTRNHARRRKSEHQPATRPVGSNAGRGKSAQQTNAPVRAGTKQAALVDMMRTAAGATIAQMGAKMGWQPHSVRAAITGLRKRGYRVERQLEDGTSRYRIASGRRAA